jgi:flagellar assembly protein FliH
MIETRRLLKAETARGLGSKVAFNYDDLQRRCEQQLESARQQSQQILAEAEIQAAELRRRAFEEGRAAGEQAGLQSAQNVIENRAKELASGQVRQELSSTLPAIQAVVAELKYERDRWLDAWEGAAIRLSASIAEKILRCELSKRPELTANIIREALQLAAGAPDMRVRMHPLDIEQMRECSREIVDRLAGLGESALVPDESISRGGFVIETRHGVIDARLESQLDRIASELIQS